MAVNVDDNVIAEDSVIIAIKAGIMTDTLSGFDTSQIFIITPTPPSPASSPQTQLYLNSIV